MITISEDKTTCVIQGAGAYIVGAEFERMNQNCIFNLTDKTGEVFGQLNGDYKRLATTICYNDEVSHTLTALCTAGEESMSGEFFAGYKI